MTKKEPKVSVLQANAKLVKKGVLDLESEVQGFNTHRSNILLLDFFCFHVVKPLMPILALLPISGVSKNLYLYLSFIVYISSKVKLFLEHDPLLLFKIL